MNDTEKREMAEVVPADTDKTAAKARIFRYNNMTIRGADLEDLMILVTDKDDVELSALVKSRNTQTKQNGPHHKIALFVVDGGQRKEITVFMGEFHWTCGYGDVKRLRKPIPGAYAGTTAHPKWNIESPPVFGC